MNVRIDNTQVGSMGRLSKAEEMNPANSSTFSVEKDLKLSSENRVHASQPSAPSVETRQQVDEMARAIIRVLDGETDDLESSSTISKLNELMRDRERDLEFLIDDSTGKNVLKVLHAQSQEVIRQFPSEEVLRVAEFIVTGKTGLLNDHA
ncbi:flagellar protein FlaG [Spongiibacter sp. KMU-158]|uniref:Flagellar protein FlaG n=1 Tax=Spongiibacter pelagi TaxID=2760804 RepID=A0A927GWH2_9GAMM|nr:flagellar protein FlaG [Spongiibacter pelagi]MBD2858424.1 flagellar protein FlaG [Spongiibacter pelagi]